MFGFAGIFASKKIKFVQKNFYIKQNLIYLSIFYVVTSKTSKSQNH